MVKIKDLYAIAAPAINLADWTLEPHWFPEVDALEYQMTSEFLETLQAQGRLVARQLLEKYYDHRRSASMHTIWFDGEPVMLVQSAGRERDDFKQRWITNEKAYVLLCSYIRSCLSTGIDPKDVVGPEEEIFEDEIFKFYGEDFAEQFGYKCEPIAEGYMVFSDSKLIFPGLEDDLYFVEAEAGLEMPQYIRRRGFVLKKEREVSEAEHASNPRVREACAESGYSQTYFYRACERPENEPILSV